MGDLISILLGLMILLVIFLIIVAASYYSKADIRAPFQVSDKTFQRWLDRLMPAYALTWKSSKKISGLDYFRIREVLGDPSKFPTLNKVGIMLRVAAIEKEELPAAFYRSLRKAMRMHTQELELVGMCIFPPRIAQQLFQMAKGGRIY
jgi:hypothetical protein